MEKLALPAPEIAGESPQYLSEQIITYIGNKRSLLPFIGEGLDIAKKRLSKHKLRLLDLFSGSGIVSRYFKQHAEHIIANDLEDYSKISNLCYLTNASDISMDNLADIAAQLRTSIKAALAPGFITELYAPLDEKDIREEDRCFYTRRNAMFLDTAIKVLSRLDERERILFLAPLLSRASVHANTSGVFKGFYKNERGVGQFGGNGKDALTRILGEIDIDVPVFSRFDCTFEVHKQDANSIVNELPEVDVAYFDPPYNQHPYGSNYFMLNLLVNYKLPMEISRVSGIPADWNRSNYNQRKEAEKNLFELVEKVRAKFVLISYNSEGFVNKEKFVEELEKIGKINVLETQYNTFRGSRNLQNRNIHVTEFLYLVEKY